MKNVKVTRPLNIMVDMLLTLHYIDTRIINSFKECLNYLRKMSYKVGFPALVVASCTDSELLPNGMLGCFKHELNFEVCFY